jgi:hypothetical protein
MSPTTTTTTSASDDHHVIDSQEGSRDPNTCRCRDRVTEIPPHITSTSFHKALALLLAQHCRQRTGLSMSTRRYIYERALVTHMIYPLQNVSLIAMRTSASISFQTQQLMTTEIQEPDKGYISNNGYLWYTALKIEPGLVSCMFGGGGGCEREGICVALKR